MVVHDDSILSGLGLPADGLAPPAHVWQTALAALDDPAVTVVDATVPAMDDEPVVPGDHDEIVPVEDAAHAPDHAGDPDPSHHGHPHDDLHHDDQHHDDGAFARLDDDLTADHHHVHEHPGPDHGTDDDAMHHHPLF